MFKSRETNIGSGAYGKIKRDELPYMDGEGNLKHASFCITKEFTDSVSPTRPAEYYAKKAIANYALAKDAKLKLETSSDKDNVGISLYKLSPNKKEIVMNDLELHGWKLLNKQNSDAKEVIDKIEIDLEKFKKLINDMLHQAIEATEKNIFLAEDCFFILTRKRADKNTDEIDFVIGDFDSVEENSFYDAKYIKKTNISKTIFALKYILRTFFSNKDQCQEILQGKINEMLNDGMDLDEKIVSMINKEF
jgi:hypothetical protein